MVIGGPELEDTCSSFILRVSNFEVLLHGSSSLSETEPQVSNNSGQTSSRSYLSTVFSSFCFCFCSTESFPKYTIYCKPLPLWLCPKGNPGSDRLIPRIPTNQQDKDTQPNRRRMRFDRHVTKKEIQMVNDLSKKCSMSLTREMLIHLYHTHQNALRKVFCIYYLLLGNKLPLKLAS